MKIRTVTYCGNLDKEENRNVASLLAKDAYASMPFDVETFRATTTPCNGQFDSKEEAVDSAVSLECWAQKKGIDYVGGFGLGTYPTVKDLEFLEWVPDIIGYTKKIFSNCQIALDKKVSIAAIRKAAQTVKELSKIEEGFANLRFAAMYNCDPDYPFYPASYSDDFPSFTVGISAADLAISAFSEASTLEQARDNLVNIVRDRSCEIISACIGLEQIHGVFFKGIDFTLAPSVEMEGSIANALEGLGSFKFGESSTLFFSAFLADAIKSLGGMTGFSGLMYPVLEDPLIAKRAKEGIVSVESLLMYSSVCGTGLDCIPIPGDVDTSSIESLMLDVAGLSTRLSKPLITRLMPLPGKVAGDMTEFDFSYFVNTKVMDIKKGSIEGIKDDEYTFLI